MQLNVTMHGNVCVTELMGFIYLF